MNTSQARATISSNHGVLTREEKVQEFRQIMPDMPEIDMYISDAECWHGLEWMDMFKCGLDICADFDMYMLHQPVK